MGNHCIDCDFCGECGRCSACSRDCPREKYETSMRAWRHARAIYADEQTALLRKQLEVAEVEASTRFATIEIEPVRPKMLHER